VNWQRLFDVLMQRPAQPNDERSRRGEQLATLERQTVVAKDVAIVQAKAARSRLDAYRRVHLGRQ
jgi:hypothetical protein